MFFELLDGGHKPVEINYKEIASNWMRQTLFKKSELDCLENEWLKKTADHVIIIIYRASQLIITLPSS